MQYSGILVRLRPEAFDEGLAALSVLEDVEVHHREPETGRVVVVVESEALAGQEEALHRIRAVPGVVLAEPVYHYDPSTGSGTPDARSEDEEDVS